MLGVICFSSTLKTPLKSTTRMNGFSWRWNNLILTTTGVRYVLEHVLVRMFAYVQRYVNANTTKLLRFAL